MYSLDVIRARVAAIGIALGHELDSTELRMLNAELDRLLNLLIEMAKVK